VAIDVEGAAHLLEPGELTIVRRASGALVVEEDGGFVAAIDPTVTPELRTEGLVRELVSRVQRMRKEAGLAVSDRIVLGVAGDPEVEAAIRAYRDHVAGEVLARQLLVGHDAGGGAGRTTGAAGTEPRAHQLETEIDGRSVRITLIKGHT
jgi:isoleucyl-tRNA synthetase